MANWASTAYIIEGNSEDLQQLNELCKAFLRRERPVMEEGASEEWEGNIILALGIDKGNGEVNHLSSKKSENEIY